VRPSLGPGVEWAIITSAILPKLFSKVCVSQLEYTNAFAGSLACPVLQAGPHPRVGRSCETQGVVVRAAQPPHSSSALTGRVDCSPFSWVCETDELHDLTVSVDMEQNPGFQSFGVLEAGSFLADRYELVDLIGSGGMGEVWQAKDKTLERLVAVKLAAEHTAKSDQFAQRFRREAKLCASLSHPNVIALYDWVVEPDRAFIVMELINGPSVRQLLDTATKLSVRETLGVAKQVLAGLQHAHDHGIIHRDIKPGNILVAGHDGSQMLVKIGDFGIAKDLADEQTLTQGAVLGTPSYLAPEIATGTAPSVASDLYAVGCLLYECLTGHPPYGGDATAVVHQHRHAPIPVIERECPSLPRSVALWLRRSLAKDPAKRFPSAADMLEALPGAQDVDESREPPAGTGGQDPRRSSVTRERQTPLPPDRPLQPAPELVPFVERWYAQWAVMDVRAMTAAMSPNEGVLTIGTAGEWWLDYDRIAANFAVQATEMPAFSVRPQEVQCWREETVAWLAARATITMDDGTEVPTVMTMVLREEGTYWRIVHIHHSIPVPDVEAFGVELTTAIDDVLAGAQGDQAQIQAAAGPAGSVTIVFTDIEGSTELLELLGEDRWLRLIAWYNGAITAQTELFGGSVIKSQGDGLMLAFSSPGAAVACASSVQKVLQGGWEDIPIGVRIGLHSGQTHSQDGDFFGQTVVVAARIAAAASAGEVLVSDAIRHALAGSVSVGRSRRIALKGLQGDHTVHPVLWASA